VTTPPPEDVWTVAVHTGVEDFQPIGAGVIAGEHAVPTIRCGPARRTAAHS